MKLHFKKNDSGFVLLMSIMLIVFLGILMGAGIFRTDMQLREARQRIDSQNAFYSAESGIDRAVFELRTNIGWRPGVGGQPAVVDVPVRSNPTDPATTLGFYSIHVYPAPPINSRESVFVRSEGKDAFKVVPRTIDARVILINPASFITSSLGDLHLGSGAHLDFDVLGKEVFFDINKSIASDTDRKVEITNRDVYYLNPNGLHNQDDPDVSFRDAIQSPSITFAGVDMDRYRKIVAANDDQGYVDGDFHYTGPINMSTVPNTNGLVVAKGDIYISGDYSDSMLFVAGGNIYIDGNLKSDKGTNAQVPQVGLLASKDIIIPDSAPANLDVEGFLMADGAEGSKGGVFIADGDKFAKGSLNFKGSIAIRGNNATTGVDLNVYKDRTYTYNNQLSENRLIPYLPFIANVVSWKEVNPNDAPPK